jgi:hypothetical protein
LRVKEGEECVQEKSEEIEGVVLLAVTPREEMRGSVATWDVMGRGAARQRLEKD